MPSPAPSVASAILTPDEIFNHPRFAAGRATFVDGVIALHEGDAHHSRLLVEAMRQVTFNLIISLHLSHDVADRTTWPTPRRLKDELKTFGLSSERRVDALLSRFIQLGYVEQLPSEQDGRVRILKPTPKMMSIDREWLVYHYAPLHVMFPERGYREPVARDVTFQRIHRLVALDFSSKGAEIMASHPQVMRFMTRDAGMLVLIKLVQMRMTARDGDAGLTYADIGKKFGVSRTHVRSLLEDAAQHGDVTLSGRGGLLVELNPPLLQSFDRFVADAMSGHDLLYRLAMERMAKEAQQPRA